MQREESNVSGLSFQDHRGICTAGLSALFTVLFIFVHDLPAMQTPAAQANSERGFSAIAKKIFRTCRYLSPRVNVPKLIASFHQLN